MDHLHWVTLRVSEKPASEITSNRSSKVNDFEQRSRFGLYKSNLVCHLFLYGLWAKDEFLGGWYWELNSEPCTCKPCLPSSFCFTYFLDKVSCFCLGSASDHDSPTSTSWVDEITSMYHYSQLVCWDKVSLTSFAQAGLTLQSSYLPNNWCYRHASLPMAWFLFF
jgi:hypothetical protein